MSDDTTTREAVERETVDEFYRDLAFHSPPNKTAAQFAQDLWMSRHVVASVRHIMDTATPGPVTLDSGMIYTLLGQIRRERVWAYQFGRDAATTAERDRIRHAVAGMRGTEIDHAVFCGYPKHSCMCGTEGYNAALADVARIIDAEGV